MAALVPSEEHTRALRASNRVLYFAWPKKFRLEGPEASVIDVKNYSVSEVLKDGTPVIVRAIRSDDRDGILGAFINLGRGDLHTLLHL